MFSDRWKFCLTVWLVIFLSSLPAVSCLAGPPRLARLKYSGGGDWYNNPEVLPNLARFIGEQSGIDLPAAQVVVEPGSENLFEYPFVYLTGHGNVKFSETEVRNLRNYLLSGGFLYADDDYGMNESFRRELEKIFPDRPLVKLGSDHPLFGAYFDFDEVPRIHEHNPDEQPRALGIKAGGEWVVLYTYNSNISDGWAAPETHEDPPEVRRRALRFGTNIYLWVFSQ